MNKAETDYPVQSGSTFTKGLFVGALLGAAAALLYAPKPGRELRSELMDKMGTATDKTKEIASTLGEKASIAAKNVSSKTADLAKSVGTGASNVWNSVKEASVNVSEEIKDSSKEVANDAKHLAKDAAEQTEDTAIQIDHKLHSHS